MNYSPSFLPKSFPGFAAHYKPIAFHLQHSHLLAGIEIVTQRPLLLNVPTPTDVRSIWLSFAWLDSWSVKRFGSTSKPQEQKPFPIHLEACRGWYRVTEPAPQPSIKNKSRPGKILQNSSTGTSRSVSLQAAMLFSDTISLASFSFFLSLF